MNNRDFKGIWIPKNIWEDERLSPFDKVLLMEIDSLDNEDGCWKSNNSLAEFMQSGVASITRSIKKLEDLKYIKTSMKKSDYGTVRVIKMIRGVSSKRLEGSNQNDYQGITIRDNNKNKKKEQKEIILPDYIDKDLWNDFLAVRKKLKAQNTERAINGLLKKLASFEESIPGSANESINESLINSWKGVFAPKGNSSQKKVFPWEGLKRIERHGIVVYYDKPNAKVYDEHGNISDKVGVYEGMLEFLG
jgi:hypothetical protein